MKKVLYEAKPTDKQANQIAAKYGFKPTGETSAHRVTYKDQSGNTVYFSKTTSDRRAYDNFAATMRRRQRENPVPVKPDKVKPEGLTTKPSRMDSAIERIRQSSAQRRLTAANSNVRSGTQTTFSDFMNKLKPVTKPITQTVSSLQNRMSSAFSSNLKSGEIPKSATTASVRTNRGLSLRPSGGGGSIDSMVKPIEPVGSDPISSWARSTAQRRFDQRRPHFRGGV